MRGRRGGCIRLPLLSPAAAAPRLLASYWVGRSGGRSTPEEAVDNFPSERSNPFWKHHWQDEQHRAVSFRTQPAGTVSSLRAISLFGWEELVRMRLCLDVASRRVPVYRC